MSDDRLGEMLRQADIISEDQLKTALETQKMVPGELAVILSKLRIISDDRLAEFYGKELNLPVLALTDLSVSPQVSALVDVEVLEKNLVLPIRKKDEETLVLAISNPMDYNAVDEIRFLTGLRTEMSVAGRGNIQKAIDYYFHGRACKELEAAETAAKSQKQQAAKASPGGAVKVAPAEVLKSLIELLIDKKVIDREELAARLGKGK